MHPLEMDDMHGQSSLYLVVAPHLVCDEVQDVVQREGGEAVSTGDSVRGPPGRAPNWLTVNS